MVHRDTDINSKTFLVAKSKNQFFYILKFMYKFSLSYCCCYFTRNKQVIVKGYYYAGDMKIEQILKSFTWFRLVILKSFKTSLTARSHSNEGFNNFFSSSLLIPIEPRREGHCKDYDSGRIPHDTRPDLISDWLFSIESHILACADFSD